MDQALEQYYRCCLNPEYYRQVQESGTILFSDRYVVQHHDHWTLGPLNPDEIKASPSFYPGVKVFYPANASTEKQARKECRKMFDAVDANCNTCRFLCREKQEKHLLGTMYGTCEKKQERISFNPEEVMLMPCYESRD